jgi:hypothetical protein
LPLNNSFCAKKHTIVPDELNYISLPFQSGGLKATFSFGRGITYTLASCYCREKELIHTEKSPFSYYRPWVQNCTVISKNYNYENQ